MQSNVNYKPLSFTSVQHNKSAIKSRDKRKCCLKYQENKANLWFRTKARRKRVQESFSKHSQTYNQYIQITNYSQTPNNILSVFDGELLESWPFITSDLTWSLDAFVPDDWRWVEAALGRRAVVRQFPCKFSVFFCAPRGTAAAWDMYLYTFTAFSTFQPFSTIKTQ